MTYDAIVLTVQVQYGQPFVWAIVDTEETTTVYKTFRIFGTGHQLSYNLDELKYISTIQFNNGTLVFHVFEVI